MMLMKYLKKKTNMPNPTKEYTTIRDMIKENRDKDKILRYLDFTFDLVKGHYEPEKAVSIFNNNCIKYESIGDKDNSLSIT